MKLEDFITRLGTVFIPATALMQTPIGLCAYIPSVVAGVSDKPDTAPDETAVLFWESQQVYRDAFKTLSARTYTLSHGGVFLSPQSRANFPVPLADTLTAEQPYYLFDTPADWMHGITKHLVGTRPESQTPADFMASIRSWAASEKQRAAQGLDGAILCAGENYLVYWEHWIDTGSSAASNIGELATRVGPVLQKDPEPTYFGGDLWGEWSGLSVKSGDSMNTQFTRRQEVDPRRASALMALLAQSK
jgi:hypothetical protein